MFSWLLLLLGGLQFGAANSIPRGYCTQASRAIPSDARCYKHLAANGPLPAEGANQELVYVRLETVGARLDALTTRPVNERLFGGLQSLLLAPPTSSRGVRDENGTQPQAELLSLIEDVRMQIAATPRDNQVAAGEQPHSGRQDAREEADRAHKCSLALERFLCRLVYPSCHFRRSDVSALVRPPCRDDCLLLRDVYCAHLDWAAFAGALRGALNLTLMSTINTLDLAVSGDSAARTIDGRIRDLAINNHSATANLDTHAHINHNNNNTASSGPSMHFYWPHEASIQRCESLPTGRAWRRRPRSAGPARAASLGQGHDNNQISGHGKDSERKIMAACSSARLAIGHRDNEPDGPNWRQDHRASASSSDGTQFAAATTSSKLRPSNGSDYSGARNFTRNHIECQHWQAQWPHRHPTSELLFDNMKDSGHNYCRNPGGIRSRPWCYTTRKDLEWDYCELAEPS